MENSEKASVNRGILTKKQSFSVLEKKDFMLRSLLPFVSFLADTEAARLRTSPSTAALARRNSQSFYFNFFLTDLDREERRLGQLMLGVTD